MTMHFAVFVLQRAPKKNSSNTSSDESKINALPQWQIKDKLQTKKSALRLYIIVGSGEERWKETFKFTWAPVGLLLITK